MAAKPPSRPTTRMFFSQPKPKLDGKTHERCSGNVSSIKSIIFDQVDGLHNVWTNPESGMVSPLGHIGHQSRSGIDADAGR